MASHLFKLVAIKTPAKTTRSTSPVPKPQTLFFSFQSDSQLQQTHHLLSHQKPSYNFKILSSSQTQLPSTSSPFTPPSSREEAILQAKTCLSTTLQKPLNNPVLLPRQKLRKQKQPRFRVEIPVIDDSPSSLSQLAFEVFSDLPITRKGARPSILILWPDPASLDSAHQVFVESSSGSSNCVVNSDFASVASGVLNSVDMVVFMSPEASLLDQMRMVCEDLYPKPAVLFNPKWGFEEEGGFGDRLGGFVGTFDVIYSFMGLEVRGLLSRRNGVVFRCVEDGVLSGEEWLVFVDDEEKKGELKLVSRFRKRPAIGDVESVLYNLMAANSPVAKSVKFLRDLASNVTGRKGK